MHISHRSGLGPNQICTLFGSTPGDSDVSGGAYLSVGYGIDIADQWRRNFLVLVGFFLLTISAFGVALGLNTFGLLLVYESQHLPV